MGWQLSDEKEVGSKITFEALNPFIGMLAKDTIANVHAGVALIGEIALQGDHQLELNDNARTGLYLLANTLGNALQYELNR